MRPNDNTRAAKLRGLLQQYHQGKHPLPGIKTEERKTSFVEQLIESLRRIEYVHLLRKRTIIQECKDPHHLAFNPLKAAILYKMEGNLDEAFWVTFLATHFGYHPQDGWRLMQDVYAGYTRNGVWTWTRTAQNLPAFDKWISDYADWLGQSEFNRRFGNHRRYETLVTKNGQGAFNTINAYIRLVGHNQGHERFFESFRNSDGSACTPTQLFDEVFFVMNRNIPRFARLAVFDFLTMVGKLGLWNITPASPYIAQSSGPKRGAELLFFGGSEGKVTGTQLNALVMDLAKNLGVGMQEMEDALCNWQKSPDNFIPFRG